MILINQYFNPLIFNLKFYSKFLCFNVIELSISGNDGERIGTGIAQHDGTTSAGNTGVEARAYKGITGCGIACDAQIESAIGAIANRVDRQSRKNVDQGEGYISSEVKHSHALIYVD